MKPRALAAAGPLRVMMADCATFGRRVLRANWLSLSLPPGSTFSARSAGKREHFFFGRRDQLIFRRA